MANSIVTIPSTAQYDYDYLAFSFNGKHSWDDFGIYRVSDGDRYNIEIGPQSQDKTAENTGGDGMYFFGSQHKQKVFDISFAFDSLTDSKLRKLKQWLSGKEIGDLWFEEEPYKVYSVKVTGQPSIKVIPFDGTSEREYRGEGSVQFTAYWPYAHTPDFVETKTNMNTSGYNPTNKGKLWSKYGAFQNRNDWGLSSGLAIKSGSSLTDAFTTTCNGENPGDLPAPFVLTKTGELGTSSTSSVTFAVGSISIIIPPEKITTSGATTTYTHYKDLEWNSKTGMVSARKNNAASTDERVPIPYTGTSTGAIPVGGVTGKWGIRTGTSPSFSYNSNNCTLTYHYWYY